MFVLKKIKNKKNPVYHNSYQIREGLSKCNPECFLYLFQRGEYRKSLDINSITQLAELIKANTNEFYECCVGVGDIITGLRTSKILSVKEYDQVDEFDDLSKDELLILDTVAAKTGLYLETYNSYYHIDRYEV